MTVNISQETVQAHLRRILACGPRGVGSAGAPQAAEVMAEQFEGAALEVTRQPFTVSRWPVILAGQVVPMIVAGALVVAGMLHAKYPPASAAVLIVVLLAIGSTRQWFRWAVPVFRLGKQIPSANIIGRSQPSSSGRMTLVFLAHYDSKSQRLPLTWRVATLVVTIVVCVALLVVMMLHVPPAVTWTLIAAAGLGLAIQVVNVTGNRSPGAADNASGLAVLATLAETLPREMVGKADVVLVATGAEELGLAGALHFVREYAKQFDPRRTLCFNFDTLGLGGRIHTAGSVRPFEHIRGELDRRLSARRLRWLPGIGTDHMRLLDAGLWAVSLTQGPFRKTRLIHSRHDTADAVDSAELARIAQAVADLATSVVKETGDG